MSETSLTMEVFKEFQLFGTPDQLTDFLVKVSKATPVGWDHSKRFEAMVNGTYDFFTRPETADFPRARVALFSKKNSDTAKVVNIKPNRGQLTIRQYNQVLREFIRFVDPVAESLGIQAEETSDRAEIGRWLSQEATEALLSFSQAANKATGSGHPLDFDRWARFIIRTHRDGSELSTSLLERYLVEVLGWNQEQASQLGTEYEFGLALLKANDGID